MKSKEYSNIFIKIASYLIFMIRKEDWIMRKINKIKNNYRMIYKTLIMLKKEQNYIDKNM